MAETFHGNKYGHEIARGSLLRARYPRHLQLIKSFNRADPKRRRASSSRRALAEPIFAKISPRSAG
jgi:hypothetical protein